MCTHLIDSISEKDSSAVHAVRAMKKKKSVRPNAVPLKVWNILEDVSIGWLEDLFNKMLVDEKMSEVLRKGFVVPIFKGKNVIIEIYKCGNH